MVELIRTNDPVLLSWLCAALSEERIEAIVLDTHTSSIFVGGLDGIARRVMVDEADLGRAQRVLAARDGDSGGR